MGLLPERRIGCGSPGRASDRVDVQTSRFVAGWGGRDLHPSKTWSRPDRIRGLTRIRRVATHAAILPAARSHHARGRHRQWRAGIWLLVYYGSAGSPVPDEP